MKRRQVTIHAPGNFKQEWDAHDKIAKLLSSALRQCINTFFEGWEIDWENWATVYTTSSSLSNNAAPR
jgi:hypothetical protein